MVNYAQVTLTVAELRTTIALVKQIIKAALLC